MLNAGTLIIARDLWVPVGREHPEMPATYGNVTVHGRVMQREPVKFVGWTLSGAPMFEPAARKPTRDPLGYYWVKPIPTEGSLGMSPVMIHESELEVVQ